MNFRSVFPLVDIKDEFTFQACHTNEEFLTEIVQIYFSTSDQRTKESALAVFMAYRDHYPKYLYCLSNETKVQLDSASEAAPAKVIKLRRLALSALSKVA